MACSSGVPTSKVGMPAWLGSGDGLLPGCRLLVPTGWQGQGGFLGPLVSRAPPSRPNRPKAPPPDTIALGIGFRSMIYDFREGRKHPAYRRDLSNSVGGGPPPSLELLGTSACGCVLGKTHSFLLLTSKVTKTGFQSLALSRALTCS